MDEMISYKMCAVKVRNAKLRNYLKGYPRHAFREIRCNSINFNPNSIKFSPNVVR
jgi:hypothetical protein